MRFVLALCYALGMRHEPNLFDPADDDAEAKANVRADDDVRSGRLISHGAVRKWLESWISGKPTPSGASRHLPQKVREGRSRGVDRTVDKLRTGMTR